MSEEDASASPPATPPAGGEPEARNSTAAFCPRCQTPSCTAHVRIAEQPGNLLDLIDRFLTRLTSDHWGWKQTFQLLLLLVALLPIAAMAYLPIPITFAFFR